MAVSPPLEITVTAGMLLKEAAYTAAGHVYYKLSNYLNFDEWFHGYLSIDLSNSNPNMCIIRRRIALLLGQWVSEIEGITWKVVYHAWVGLLQDKDITVRLAACSSLCYIFRESSFLELDLFECLPTCWVMCFKLAEDVQEFDSKKIWEESAGESLLQIQLLAAIRLFVSTLGYQCPLCYDMVLPLIQCGINVDSPDTLNLLEDTVLLWETTLSNAPSIIPQLLDFFPYLVGIVNRSLDHLEVVINIIEHYIIFVGSVILQRHATSLATILDTIVENVNDKGLLTTFPIIDLLIQMFPQKAPPLISGALQKLVFVSLSGSDEHDPSRSTVHVTSGAILARLLLMNTNFLAQLLSEPALIARFQQARISVNQNLLLCLVDLWIDKVDDANSIQQKEYAMALSIILTSHEPGVIEKLGDILSLCTTVIIGGHERKTDDDSSSGVTSSSLLFNDDQGYSNTSKEFKRAQIRDSDPIKQGKLADMLRENLKACVARHGDAVCNAAIGRMHPAALAQLQQVLKIV